MTRDRGTCVILHAGALPDDRMVCLGEFCNQFHFFNYWLLLKNYIQCFLLLPEISPQNPQVYGWIWCKIWNHFSDKESKDEAILKPSSKSEVSNVEDDGRVHGDHQPDEKKPKKSEGNANCCPSGPAIGHTCMDECWSKDRILWMRTLKCFASEGPAVRVYKGSLHKRQSCILFSNWWKETMRL